MVTRVMMHLIIHRCVNGCWQIKKLDVIAFQWASIPFREEWKFSLMFCSAESRCKTWVNTCRLPGWNANYTLAYLPCYMYLPTVYGYFDQGTSELHCFKRHLFFFIGVLEEAEFYNIDPLVRIIKDRIQSREARQKLPVSFLFYINSLV